MTHMLTLDDWDSDGGPQKVACDCERGEDHPQDLVVEITPDTSRFEANLKRLGHLLRGHPFRHFDSGDRGLVWREP